MWVIWLLFSAFIGWAHGYIGMSILGVVYIIALFLYPFIHLFAKKESAQKIYYGINGKEGIQCIVLFLTILFPLAWMICEPSGKLTRIPLYQGLPTSLTTITNTFTSALVRIARSFTRPNIANGLAAVMKILRE